MSHVDNGMNLAEVEALGSLLRSKADELSQMATALEAAVRRPAWAGPNAQRFRTQWWPQHRSSLTRIAEQLDGFGQSALNNAAEQRQASDDAAPSANATGAPRTEPPRAPGALPRGEGVPVYELNRHGFSTSSKFGFIVTGESKGESQFIYHSDGKATYELALEETSRIDLGDVKRLIEIGAITKTQSAGAAADQAGLEARFDAEFSTSRSVVVASWVGRDPSTVGEIGNHFVGKQASASNQWWAGGQFDVSDVSDSIRHGEVPRPDVVRRSTDAVDGNLSFGVEQGGRGGDLVVESSAQRFVTEYRQTGDVGSGVAFEVKSGTHVTLASASLGPFGAELGLDSSELRGGSIEIVRDSNGVPLRIEVSESHGIENSAGVNLFDFYSASSGQSVVLERSLSFDLKDPSVRAAFGSEPNLGSALAGYMSHSQLASETVILRQGGSDTESGGVWTAGGSAGTSSSTTVGVVFRDAGTGEFRSR